MGCVFLKLFYVSVPTICKPNVCFLFSRTSVVCHVCIEVLSTLNVFLKTHRNERFSLEV